MLGKLHGIKNYLRNFEKGMREGTHFRGRGRIPNWAYPHPTPLTFSAEEGAAIFKRGIKAGI
jgi:hypothetical protein